MKISLLKKGMLPEYFTFLFNGSPFVLGQVSKLCKGSTRNFLNQDILKRLVLILPPHNEQEQITKEVDRHFTIISGVEKEIGSNLKRANRLRQSILKQAFSGQLVPSDPADEPASVLLDRIRKTSPDRTRKKKTSRTGGKAMKKEKIPQ